MKEPARYRWLRAAARAAMSLGGRPIRVLGADRLPGSAAVLVVCRPFGFLDALLLIAACDGHVRCLVDREHLRGWSGLIVRGLGMIGCEDQGPRWHTALRSSSEALRAGCSLAVFAEPEKAGKTPIVLVRAAWASAFPEEAPMILPVHRFWPARPAEIVVHIGHPVRLSDDKSSSGHDVQEEFEAAIANVCRSNVFALYPQAFEQLAGDLEEALRTRLAQEWAARPGRKQSAEGFRLSPRAAEILRQANRVEPEGLSTLRQLNDACRESRRRWSLVRLRAELARTQLSPLQRVLGWLESLAGLPVACYGASNHLAAGVLLLVLGLLKRNAHPGPGPWLARGLIVAGCYAGQIAIVDHLSGRAAAGYYALTLPLSGLYLWRYTWVLSRRTRILLLGARGAVLQRIVARRRRRFFERLEAVLTTAPKTVRA